MDLECNTQFPELAFNVTADEVCYRIATPSSEETCHVLLYLDPGKHLKLQIPENVNGASTFYLAPYQQQQYK